MNLAARNNARCRCACCTRQASNFFEFAVGVTIPLFFIIAGGLATVVRVLAEIIAMLSVVAGRSQGPYAACLAQ